MLEVHDGCPVVGEVLGHLAGSTCTSGADISGHGGIEGVATDDMMKMCGWGIAGLHNGVKPLDSQGRASEAEACLGSARKRERQNG